MRASKIEIYLPPYRADLWPAFRQYLAKHVLHMHYTPPTIVVLAEKSAALDKALGAAIAYAEAKTDTPIPVAITSCNIIIKE